jgi:hypothetical protein
MILLRARSNTSEYVRQESVEMLQSIFSLKKGKN